MKKLSIFGLAFVLSFLAFSQNDVINYKALISDGSGSILSSEVVSIRFTIFADAAQVYQETHNTTTDANGIAIVNIGNGNSSDDFNAIDWTDQLMSLTTEIDTGSGFVSIGNTVFRSVPFALNVLNTQGLKVLRSGINSGWRLETDPFLDGATLASVGDKSVDMTIHDDSFWGVSGASGRFSFAANKDTWAEGDSSATFGNETNASGIASFAAGATVQVSGNTSAAFGNDNVVSGSSSLAAGSSIDVSGSRSSAFGLNLTVSSDDATVVGRHNVNFSNALFVVGNGSSGVDRSNALTVLGSGETTANGQFRVNSEFIAPDADALQGLKTHSAGQQIDAKGVYGENTVDDYYGIGVEGVGGWRGVAGRSLGFGNNRYYGVFGDASGFNSGINYGVYGTASGGATNYAVYAEGDLAHTGVIVEASDRKLKTNIQSVSNAIESIILLNPKSYTIKQEYIDKMNMSTLPQIGFIAQELQQVFPNLVTNNVHPGRTKKDQKIEYLGVNYIGLIPILTAGIKEQQQIIQQQQQTIDAQEIMLQNLLSRVEALENRD